MDDLAKIAFLAMVNESTVEYLFGWLKGHGLGATAMKWIAAASGIAFSVAFGIDLFAAFGLTASVPVIGSVLTGLVVARGSDFLHNLGKTWGVKQPKS